MRLFGGERVQRIMETRSIDPDEAIEAKILTGAIERAQKKVEANNFATRKHVLEYDDVMNLQRNVIYKERRAVLDGENMKENIIGMIKELIFAAVDSFCNSENPEEWEMSGLFNYLNSIYLEKGQIVIDNISSFNKEKLKSYLLSKTNELYDKKEEEIGEEMMREIERIVILQSVDSEWMDHIDQMDQLRQGIGLRSYGQENPVRAYEKEGFDMFEEMNHTIIEKTIKLLFSVQKPEKMERKKQFRETSASAGEQLQMENQEL